MEFFTADIHLGHHRLLEYERGDDFKTVEECDEYMLQQWNKKVTRKDTVYIIGDVSMTNSKYTIAWLNKANGKKILIKGNHDKKMNGLVRDCFQAIYDFGKEINIRLSDDTKKKVVLCHYALKVWNRSHYGSWHLYGHSHGNLVDAPNERSWDVGMDNNRYEVLSVPDLEEIMSKKLPHIPIDHHAKWQGKEDDK